MNQEELRVYSKPLIGHRLISVEKLDHTWFFKFAGDITVATESLWRLLAEGRIAVTSEDHGHQFGLPKPVDAAERVLVTTTGLAVVAAEISQPTGDLIINFGGQVQLQLLQDSCGYEAWRLSAQGHEIICTGGGYLSHFPRG